MFQAKKSNTSYSSSSSKPNRRPFQKPQNQHSRNNGNSSSSSSSSPRKPFQKTFQKFTLEVHEKLIKEGKCLYCQESGHKVATCPKKPKVSSSATSISFPKHPPPSSAPISSAMVTAKPALRKPIRTQPCVHHPIPEPVQHRVQCSPPPAPTPPPSSPPHSVTSSSSEEEIKQHNYEHGKYSWTACYENSCPIHYSDKTGSGYFPKKPKRNDQIPQYVGKDPWDSEVQPSTGKENFIKNTSYDDLFPPLPTPHRNTCYKKNTYQKPQQTINRTPRVNISPNPQKNYGRETQRPLVVLVSVNGFSARALIDTATIGTNLISKKFCFTNQIPFKYLSTPVQLSLALKSSSSHITQEISTLLDLGKGIKDQCTLRLASLDQWDIILGMLFLSRNKVVIDLQNRTIWLPCFNIFLNSYWKSERASSSATQLTQEPDTLFDPIKEFPDVFPENPPNTLPPLRENLNHRIHLKDPTKVLNPATFPIPPKYHEALRKKLDKDLESGRIYQSSSFQAANLFCVPKPGGNEARFVTDLRQRNTNAIRDIFPIPHQHTILNR